MYLLCFITLSYCLSLFLVCYFQSIVKKVRSSKRGDIFFSNEVLPTSVAINDNLIIETNLTEASKLNKGNQKRENMIVQAASREYHFVLICYLRKKERQKRQLDQEKEMRNSNQDSVLGFISRKYEQTLPKSIL